MRHGTHPALLGLLFGSLIWPVRASAQWRPVAPSQVRRTGVFRNVHLVESSGAAVSRTQPGILWTQNDSGNDPWLFAVDTTGETRAIFAVTGASNQDWEEIAFGACPRGLCIYIADTGDNRERRHFVRLYRVPEPLVGKVAGASGATAPADSLLFVYPDGPHDVEAMYVDEGSRVHLITKGRSGPVEHFVLPALGWNDGARHTATLVERLPISIDAATGRLVTGAALSPDRKAVVVRTYRDLFLFERSLDGHLVPARGPNQCSVFGFEPQGEGIDWWDESTLVLTSESRRRLPGTIILLRCPPKD